MRATVPVMVIAQLMGLSRISAASSSQLPQLNFPNVLPADQLVGDGVKTIVWQFLDIKKYHQMIYDYSVSVPIGAPH